MRPLIAPPRRLSANTPKEINARSGRPKNLNNLIDRAHRLIKLRLGPMLGPKNFRRAATTIAGIELMHRIRKGQFKLGNLRVKNKTDSEIWKACSPRNQCRLPGLWLLGRQRLHYNPSQDQAPWAGPTPYEFIRKLWTKEPKRFTINPIQEMPGLNIQVLCPL